MPENQHIRRIEVPQGPIWIVGDTVVEIKDHSLEYDDHIHSIYDVFDGRGELMARIENVGVIIEYFTKK